MYMITSYDRTKSIEHIFQDYNEHNFEIKLWSFLSVSSQFTWNRLKVLVNPVEINFDFEFSFLERSNATYLA